MKIIEFLDNIQQNCSHITSLSITHILYKLYDKEDDIDERILIDKITNYQTFTTYLNDYAQVIYKQYESSIEIIYKEICDYFHIESINKSTIEKTIKKLENQTPAFIMSLEDKDIQIQVINNFTDKLNNIKQLKFYQTLTDIPLKNRIDKLQSNIDLVKKALQC